MSGRVRLRRSSGTDASRGWAPFALLGCVFLGGCSSSEEPAAGPGRDGALFDAPAPRTGGAAPRSHPAPIEIPADAPTVVFLGDSVAAGLHLPERQAFPSVLQRRLAANGLPFHLVSSCESGRTTSGGVTALEWVLRSKPELVVIQLGGNDGLRGIELADTEANLRKLIERSREAGAKVLLLGVRLPPNYGEYGAAFDAMYPRLAAEYELAFRPYFMEGVGGVPELNLEDGLHPTPEGQEKLADNVEAALREALGGS